MWVHQHFDTGHCIGPSYILTESFDGWLRNPFSKLPTSNTRLTRTALMSVCWTTAFLDSWLGSTSSRRLTSCLASVSFSLASTSQWAAASSDLLLALAGLPSWERPIQRRVPVSPCTRHRGIRRHASMTPQLSWKTYVMLSANCKKENDKWQYQSVLTYPMPMAAPISPFSSERRKSWRPARSVSVGVSGRTSRHISWATHQPAVRNRNCNQTGDYCEQRRGIIAIIWNIIARRRVIFFSWLGIFRADGGQEVLVMLCEQTVEYE